MRASNMHVGQHIGPRRIARVNVAVRDGRPVRQPVFADGTRGEVYGLADDVPVTGYIEKLPAGPVQSAYARTPHKPRVSRTMPRGMGADWHTRLMANLAVWDA